MRDKDVVISVTFSKDERKLIKRILAGGRMSEAHFIRDAAVWMAERRAEAPRKDGWLQAYAKEMAFHAGRVHGLLTWIQIGIKCIPPDKMDSVRKPKGLKPAA